MLMPSPSRRRFPFAPAASWSPTVEAARLMQNVETATPTAVTQRIRALPMRDGARGQHQPQFLSALDDARIYRELSVELAAHGQRSDRQATHHPAIDDGLLQRTGFVAGHVLCAHH